MNQQCVRISHFLRRVLVPCALLTTLVTAMLIAPARAVPSPSVTSPDSVTAPLVVTTTTLKLNADGTGTLTVKMADDSIPTNPVDLWIDSVWQKAYTLTNGVAAVNLGVQPLGDHWVSARYRNSSTHAASTTGVLWSAPGTVQQATTTTLNLNANGTGTVTVTVAGDAAPTNPVDLFVDNVWQRAYTLTNGVAAINLGTQPLGNHWVRVGYRPSSTAAYSTATLLWTTPGTVQAATTTTLKMNANGTGTVTVTVAGDAAPTNPVDLWVDNVWQRAYTLTNGTTTINVGVQPLGNHWIHVGYRPSGTAAGSSMSALWTAPGTVAAATTTTLRLNADGTGTIAVFVAGGATAVNGVDLWIDNTWKRVYTLTNGTAAINLGPQPGGDHRVTVRYRPSSTAAASSASVPWLVVTADQKPTSSTVTVLPDGTGTISVKTSGGQPGTSPVDLWVANKYKGVFPLTNGKATFALGTRAGGEVQVAVRYRPGPTELASTAQATWSVDTAPIPAPGACGDTILKGNGTPWICTFADDFAGTALNANLWRVHTDHYTGGEVKACNVSSPNNVSVQDGALRLTVLKGEPVTCWGLDGATTPYSAGRVTTFHAWSQQYGRMEARLKTTATTQPGLHEGFWMWPDTRYPEAQFEWPANGEIDIAEFRSNDPTRAVPYLHSADDLLLGPLTSGPNANTAWDCRVERGVWNTYAMEWAPDRIEIFVNGESCLVNTSGNAAFKKRYIMVLSQGLGMGTNTLDASTMSPATLSVDYVRAWS